MAATEEVVIVGGGIGGLTLALQLHEVGIAARVLEAAPSFRPLGVGINILPHASKELWRLRLEDRMESFSVKTSAAVFYNRFGQHVHTDPAGINAGYPYPQYSTHRGELQLMLAAAVRERLGEEALTLDARAIGIEQADSQAVVTTQSSAGDLSEWTAPLVVGCDGVHSVIRKTLHPADPVPIYSGVTMWRGVTRMEPFLDGASMIRAGWLATGKMVIYPIINYDDGTQLINWVAELEVPQRHNRDWNQEADVDDFIGPFEDWTFDWLDVPAMIRRADKVFEYPMVDQDPLPFWNKGRVTLLGDAAHPMVPRGANGAGQAILDTRALTDALVESGSVEVALERYESSRLPRTAEVVRLNRVNPPDALLREVHDRTGDKPFDRIDNIIPEEERVGLLERYRSVTGASLEAVIGAESAHR